MQDQIQYDAHARPPAAMKSMFKSWQKASIHDIDGSESIFNFPLSASDDRVEEYDMPRDQMSRVSDAVERFLCSSTAAKMNCEVPIKILQIKALPGLFIYPGVLSPVVQAALLDRLLHRDLSNPAHKTNLHLHYHVPAPLGDDGEPDTTTSYFSSKAIVLEPKDPTVHKPLQLDHVLQRKLRWMTLGGQYNWTEKAYPDEKPPIFPVDISQLLQSYFPDVDPQAAILNFYNPGDTLSVHRDVSEECNRGLISMSIGCDAIFIIGNEDESSQVTLRIKSGDAMVMSGSARYAWHGVPKIIAGTCPDWLEQWPASFGNEAYEHCADWMRSKRINLNVRQMQLDSPWN